MQIKFSSPDNVKFFKQIESTTGYWYWKFTIIIVAMVIVGLYFLLAGSYSQKITVKGYLSAVDTIKPVYSGASVSGIISNVYVKNGQAVKAGEPLLKVIENQAVKNKTDISEKIAILEKRLKNTHTSLKSASVLANKFTENYKNTKKAFDLNLVSYSELTRLDQQKLELENKIAEYKVNIAETTTQLDKYYYMSSTNNKDNKKFVNEFLVVAPSDGFIATSQAREGESIFPRKFLMNIIPRLAPELEAIFYVPASAIGFTSVGQIIGIHYDTFPYQKFGSFGATITQITKTPENRQNLPYLVNTANEGKTTYFELRAELNHQRIAVFSRDIPLQVGLTFTADLILDERNLIEWLFESYFGAYRRIHIL